MPTGLFLVSVVGSPLENTCPSCRTYIERNVPSFSRVLAFLAGHEECQLWSCPVSHSGRAEGGKEEEKKEKGLRIYIYIYTPTCHDRGSRWKSWILHASQPDAGRKEVARTREERTRQGTKTKSSKEEQEEIRAGTEKGEKKKKVKVQRGRKQPVQVQVFYYARLSRLWHSCFEEPGNLGWTEWGVSGYSARSPISLSLSRFSSPSASRFRCFGAPINPLLSGETPKLKKIYMCRYV